MAHIEGQWGYPGQFNYSIEVAGSRALVTADSTESPSVQLLGGAAGPGESPDFLTGKSPFQTELEHFIECLTTGAEPVVEPRDAYEALRIGLAATGSVLTGEPVTLGGGR